MTAAGMRSSRDWLARPLSNLLAWWIPHAGIAAGLFLAVPVRTAVWIVALIWMGTACIVNARRCGRTHCRFTGPYYLIMILPALASGLGLVPAGMSAWLVLAVLIVAGSKLIWWGTERSWGKFS